MLKRHPGLLGVSLGDAAVRVLVLKVLMPACNVADLIYQKPTLVLMEDLREQVGGGAAARGCDWRWWGGGWWGGGNACFVVLGVSRAGCCWLLPLLPSSSLPSSPPPIALQSTCIKVTAAIKQMQALMPGTAWQSRLGTGGTAFMSFCSILGGSGLSGSSSSNRSGSC